MKQHRKRTLLKIIFWLIAEVLLNLIGLDDLADYGEFVFEKTIETPRIAIEASLQHGLPWEEGKKSEIKIANSSVNRWLSVSTNSYFLATASKGFEIEELTSNSNYSFS